jgi:hypothetical protein
MSGVNGEQRWERRPVASWLLRAIVFLTPVAAGILAGRAAARWLPGASGALETVGWWLAVLVAATAALVVVERLARELLPLAWLLRMSLLFPTRAPRRWRLARRIGNIHRLEAQLAEAREHGIEDDTTAAAERIITLITALQAHDRRTRGHAERVRVYTDMLTEELGLPVEARDRLRWAALLHDIGKLAISGKLLNKAGPLDGDEWQSLLGHPEEGARYIAPLLPWLGPWGETVVQHHERFDGEGYPAGLSGREICLGARIVAVPDAYEVMTSPRAYKKAMSPRAARQELADNAGTQFDPAIVRAFLSLSIRRLQWVAGPAAWLAQLPFISTPPRLNPTSASLGLGMLAVVTLGVGLGGLPSAVPVPAEQVVAGDAADGDASGATEVAGPPAGNDAEPAAPPGPVIVAGAPPLDAGSEPDDPPAPDERAGEPEEPVIVILPAAPEDDEPVVVILPAPDAAPEAPVDRPGRPAPAEPDEPVVVIVPVPDPTEPAEPVAEPTEPIIVPLPPTPSPSPAASPGAVLPSPAPSPSTTATSPTAPASPAASPTPDPIPSPEPPPSTAPSPAPVPPLAVSDSVTVTRRHSITIDVLSNDTGDFDPATLAVNGRPQHGRAAAAGGVIIYTAQPGWRGTVQFGYQVCGPAGCASATVTVVITGDPAQNAAVPLPLLLGWGATLNVALRRRRDRRAAARA